MQDIVTEFFTQKYEKKINKDILYYDFPKEEVTAYVEQVINEPVDRFVAYIKGLTAKSRIETGDVIQFSNIEDATINFCEKVNEVNNPGLNFQEIGRLLQDDGIERKVGAYVKYGESGVELRLREMGKKLGVEKVHPHKFRRTMATRAIEKGMPIEQVQKILGHEQIDTTLRYAMVNQNNVKLSHRKYIS